MAEISKYLKKSRDLIDEALDRYLPRSSDEPKIIHKAMRYSVFSGGKRIRPIIVLESCRACGGRISDALIIGSAVEMVHAYSLIHDDLPSMDNDDMRRGKKTSHKVFGEANAILAGDALLTLAFNIIARHLKPATAALAVQELSEAIGTYGMVGGQVIDMAAKEKKIDAKTQDHINELKTARLFEASASLGAIAAAAPAKSVKAMATFGALMGRAFQIVDDIMDNEGYSELFGKRQAMCKAEAVTARAVAALNIFGNKACRLKEIAYYMTKRRA